MLSRMEKRRFRDFRLSTKLIIVYIVLTVIPMALLGLIGYRQYTTSIVEQIGEYMPKFLDQGNSMIDQHIDQLTALPEQLFNSSDVMRILRKGSYQSSADLNTDRYEMNNYLARTYLEGSNSEILGVFILSKNRVFSTARMDYTGMEDNNSLIPYGQDLDLRGKAKMLLSSDFSLKFENNEPYLMILKQIDDLDNRENLGTMFIAVRLTFIDDILRSFENSANAKFWLMNDQGEIFYHTDRTMLGSYDPEIYKYPVRSGSFRKTSSGESWIMSTSPSRSYDWMLVHSTRMKDLTQRTDLVRKVTCYIFSVFAVITLIISIIFSFRVTGPLEKLSRLMREVERGQFNVDPGIHTNDEVGLLAKSFTSMVSTIQDLIERNVKIELSQKEAELYALQSQINPHFMYNTLETISMAVEEGEKDTVVKMVTLLGRMLRFSVSNKTRYITIAEEIQHMRDYLTIQTFRFEDRLTFEIVSTGDEALFTPKFILQPLVENAVKYGMEARQHLHLLVRITQEDGPGAGVRVTVFHIEDNGPGIPEEKLHELNGQLTHPSPERKDSGFGLNNVNARIHFMLGAEYGLQLESRQGEGTIITVRIPVLDKEITE